MTIENFAHAVQDFRNARSRAEMKELLSRFTGASNQLLSYEEVRQKLRAESSRERGLKDIPLDDIVGSLGRYTDFTRDFLPTRAISEERWARVRAATDSMTGLPPIEVYQIGEAYFVKDGNHRVSVARQLGAKMIQAYVTEVHTRVPLTPDVQPEDLILKAEYAQFLEEIGLDVLRPEAELSVTIPGQYAILKEHIAVHRYYMGIDFQRDISLQEAVAHWYDEVYRPIVDIIRELAILHAFPGRTETDLYLWIAEHSAALQHELGWKVQPERAAADLAARFGEKPGNIVLRLGEKLLDVLTLETLETGPAPGEWRKEKQASRQEVRLFGEVLVPVSGEPEGWCGLEQALIIAQHEGARLHGLHVVPEESQAALAIQEEFNRRCREAGVTGELTLVRGEVAAQICSRSRWMDLVVTNLAYPPAPQLLSRLGSGFRRIIQRCPSPILAVPANTSGMHKALLAYDGSPKAKEALFIATYLAGQWKIPLVVVSVQQNGASTEALDEARTYLNDHQVEAEYFLERGPVGEKLLRVGESLGCDLFIMGGYGSSAVKEVVIGSVVDQVLRESRQPTLICR